jgi:hypothetical protein
MPRYWLRWNLTNLPGWPRTTILPVSASQVARIIGVSHQCPARLKEILLYTTLNHLHVNIVLRLLIWNLKRPWVLKIILFCTEPMHSPIHKMVQDHWAFVVFVSASSFSLHLPPSYKLSAVTPLWIYFGKRTLITNWLLLIFCKLLGVGVGADNQPCR